MTEPFYGNFDIASLTLWLFWLFFAGLIYYLQTENMREGYPLENDDGTEAPNQGPFPLPSTKTFRLPGGRGEVTVPDMKPEAREVALEMTSPINGYPLEPTGDPMADGVGPASWAPRKDEPELDAHGHAKIQPMSGLNEFFVSAGRDPRGLPVIAGDNKEVGKINDFWVDVPEQMIRYLSVDLGEAGVRVIPMTLARIWFGKVHVHSLYAEHFAGIPALAAESQITKLEEEKVSAYVASGKLYAAPHRQDPQL